MGEFLAEFIGHYVAIEGKLWRTLGQLLLRPGGLTKAYMAGRRVYYMQPLRLFLTLSVILFALLQFSGFSIGNDGVPSGPGGMSFSADVRQADRAAAPAPLPAHATRYAVSLAYYGLSLTRTPDDVAFGFKLSLPDTDQPSVVVSALRTVFPHFEDRLLRFDALSPEAKAERMTHGFFARMPYVIFCLVPVFALFLKLLYWRAGRPYGEYLLFALHVNAFAFFVMALMHVTPWGWTLGPLALWLLLYVGRAMQNVYAGAALATAFRWMALVVAYLLALIVAISQVMLVMAMSAH
jgi:hypothetical protein